LNFEIVLEAESIAKTNRLYYEKKLRKQ